MNQRTSNLHRFLAEEQISSTLRNIAGQSVIFVSDLTISHSDKHGYVIEKMTRNPKRPIISFAKSPTAVLHYLREIQ